MVRAALVLLMLEAVTTDLVFTISLKRSTQNLQLSSSILGRTGDQVVGIMMKAADDFKDKTTAPNQHWQIDFTYLKVTGWGWFYLSTVLDDFSRYIVAWKLCTTMKAEDVTDTLEVALQASGLDRISVAHRPRLLIRQRPELRLGGAGGMARQTRHARTSAAAPYHPMTQGKIERWHLTLKNRILLENYYLPGELEARVEAFVAHYNHLRATTRASPI